MLLICNIYVLYERDNLQAGLMFIFVCRIKFGVIPLQSNRHLLSASLADVLWPLAAHYKYMAESPESLCLHPEKISTGKMSEALSYHVRKHQQVGCCRSNLKGDTGRGAQATCARLVLTLPDTLHPLSHDQAVVLLVVDAPRWQSLNGVHGVWDILKLPVQGWF